MYSHGPDGGLPPPPTRPTATHTHIINPAVGCHYFRSPQPSGDTALRPVPSYTAWWQRHIGVRNLPRVFLRRSARPRLEPATSWSRVRHSTTTPRRHQYYDLNRCFMTPPREPVTWCAWRDPVITEHVHAEVKKDLSLTTLPVTKRYLALTHRDVRFFCAIYTLTHSLGFFCDWRH